MPSEKENPNKTTEEVKNQKKNYVPILIGVLLTLVLGLASALTYLYFSYQNSLDVTPAYCIFNGVKYYAGDIVDLTTSDCKTYSCIGLEIKCTEQNDDVDDEVVDIDDDEQETEEVETKAIEFSLRSRLTNEVIQSFEAEIPVDAEIIEDTDASWETITIEYGTQSVFYRAGDAIISDAIQFDDYEEIDTDNLGRIYRVDVTDTANGYKAQYINNLITAGSCSTGLTENDTVPAPCGDPLIDGISYQIFATSEDGNYDFADAFMRSLNVVE